MPDYRRRERQQQQRHHQATDPIVFWTVFPDLISFLSLIPPPVTRERKGDRTVHHTTSSPDRQASLTPAVDAAAALDSSPGETPERESSGATRDPEEREDRVAFESRGGGTVTAATHTLPTLRAPTSAREDTLRDTTHTHTERHRHQTKA